MRTRGLLYPKSFVIIIIIIIIIIIRIKLPQTVKHASERTLTGLDN